MRLGVGPIYHAGKVQYGIDTCLPQVRAIAEGKIRLHALTKGNYPGTRLEPTMLPGLSSIGFWDAVGPQSWGLLPHRNEGVEISFLETGRMAFTVDKRRFDLRPGSVTITRPWQLHKLGAPHIGQGRLHWLILDVGVRRPNQEWRWPRWLTLTPQDCGELTRALRLSEKPVWMATQELAHTFRRLSQCVLNWGCPHAQSHLATELNQLLVGILDLLSEQPAAEDPKLTSRRHTVELFLKDLAANPGSGGEAPTLKSMATQCGMGVTAFSKYCHELVNCGGVEFLNQCRLDRAALRLLSERTRRITEIAFENGFNSSQYFATAFRLRFHQTPREYRHQASGGLPPNGRPGIQSQVISAKAPGRTGSGSGWVPDPKQQ